MACLLGAARALVGRRALSSGPVRVIRPARGTLRCAAEPLGSSTGPLYVTTPIYYVNADPHVGHAYTSVAADAACRFARLDGRQAFLATGTDEHGQKVEESAVKAGLTPLEFATDVSGRFRSLVETYDVNFDRFVRTTEEEHAKVVDKMWALLEERGQIYLGAYEGWYCVRDECYYTEGELVDGKAPTGADVEWREKEASYFFRLSQWREALIELYTNDASALAPQSRRNEVMAFLNDNELRDLSISRTSFKWGLKVPGDDQHVVYVWLDALCNYLTVIGFADEDSDSPDAKWREWWSGSTHLVGKDILRFHAVYWPAMCMAAGLPPPGRIFAHGWWTKDGAKISKSLGNVVEPFELVEEYGVDATRFFLLSEVAFGSDGDFSRTAMLACCNGFLANAVGNLAQRVCTMLAKGDGLAPAPPALDAAADASLADEDREMLATARGVGDAMRPHMLTLRFDLALREVETVVRDANRYFDAAAPWKLKKTDPERCAVVLAVSLETLRCIAIAYQAFMPCSAEKLLAQIGVGEDDADARMLSALKSRRIPAGTPLITPVPIFPRIQEPVLA